MWLLSLPLLEAGFERSSGEGKGRRGSEKKNVPTPASCRKREGAYHSYPCGPAMAFSQSREEGLELGKAGEGEKGVGC